MNTASRDQFVTVARILRARGNKGEVAAELLTDFPERFGERKEIFLRAQSGLRHGARLSNFWTDRNHPGQGIFHFAGVDSIDKAEQFRGMEVQIPFEQRATLPSGSYFVTDLMGCAVFALPAGPAPVSSSPCAMAETAGVLGKVRDVYFPGERQAGTPLLVLDTAKGEMLVPLAREICIRIDIIARRIEVRLPEGLEEL
jgi:16S rRNA processing protein RimM